MRDVNISAVGFLLLNIYEWDANLKIRSNKKEYGNLGEYNS